MKKIVFYLPVILFTSFYGWIMIGTSLSFSPTVYVWITLFLISGILLSKGKAWGGFLGVLPGIHLMYMSTKYTGQPINIELPLSIIVTTFYLLCCGVVFYKKMKIRNQ